jgi:hypothetical protein
MDIMGYPWWALGLIVLFILISLFSLYSVIFRFLPKAYINISDFVLNKNNKLQNMDPFKNCIDTETLLTRFFISIISICTTLYYISQLPGIESPVWLVLALQAFTYISAAIFYNYE